MSKHKILTSYHESLKMKWSKLKKPNSNSKIKNSNNLSNVHVQIQEIRSKNFKQKNSISAIPKVKIQPESSNWKVLAWIFRIQNQKLKISNTNPNRLNSKFLSQMIAIKFTRWNSKVGIQKPKFKCSKFLKFKYKM